MHFLRKLVLFVSTPFAMCKRILLGPQEFHCSVKREFLACSFLTHFGQTQSLVDSTQPENDFLYKYLIILKINYSKYINKEKKLTKSHLGPN